MTVTDTAPAAVVYDYRGATAYTTFGRTTLSEAAKTGELRSIKVGRAVRFLRTDLDAWLESKARVSA